ncbi:MAG: hypothetical protein U0Y68_18010 [Blastocatellia bacterium]
MNNIASLLLCLSFLLNFCGNPAANTPNKQQTTTMNTQKIYCEQSYTNFAWGYQHHGIYVDSEGNLYSYSYQPKDKPWSPKQDAAPTAAELEEKYSHGRQFIRKLDAQEWEAKRKLFAAAHDGKLSDRKQSGADMGANICRCYVSDEAGQQYKEVTLRVQGDWSYENLAPSAKTLADWLESLRASVEKK